jgi:hypothetical protein
MKPFFKRQMSQVIVIYKNLILIVKLMRMVVHHLPSLHC